jgi:hypothetical protein
MLSLLVFVLDVRAVLAVTHVVYKIDYWTKTTGEVENPKKLI